jgi:hypothetical protein
MWLYLGWDFVDFFYLLFFSLNLCMGSKVVACEALFKMGFVKFCLFIIFS